MKKYRACGWGENDDFDSVDSESGKAKLGAATKALQWSCHPMLPNITDNEDDPSYDDWLQHLRINHSASNSSRVKCFIEIYRHIKYSHPSENIIVFSVSVRFLDIVSIALEEIGVETLLYDGSLNSKQRKAVQDQFALQKGQKPLLMTAGAGGVGLNLSAASVVVQLEIWWNRNVELQAYARAFRQRQTRDVMVYRLRARNSDVDLELLTVQERKPRINKKLMFVLLRKDDESPVIPRIY